MTRQPKSDTTSAKVRRWETYAWITLEALAITLCWFAIVAGVYAGSVLAAGIW